MSADPKLSSPDALAPDERRAALSHPQKLNLYAYALNNPLKYQDPTGLEDKGKEKNPSPGEEMAEGAGNLFLFGAERDAAEWTGSFVEHAYAGSSTPLKVVNTLTAPVWLPVVIFGSMTVSIGKDLGHVAKGAVQGVWEGASSVVNRFKTVDAEPPPPLDLPSHEETTMRSSYSAHEDAPPPHRNLLPLRPTLALGQDSAPHRILHVSCRGSRLLGSRSSETGEWITSSETERQTYEHQTNLFRQNTFGCVAVCSREHSIGGWPNRSTGRA